MGGNALIYDRLDVDQKNIIDILENYELEYEITNYHGESLMIDIDFKKNENNPFFIRNEKLNSSLYNICVKGIRGIGLNETREIRKEAVNQLTKEDEIINRIIKLTGYNLKWYSISTYRPSDYTSTFIFEKTSNKIRN